MFCSNWVALNTAVKRKKKINETINANPSLNNVSLIELWPGDERGASTAAGHVTWPSCLLLAEWSVLAGNKNTHFLTIFNFAVVISARSSHTLNCVSPEAVGHRLLRFARAGLWRMSSAIFLLSCFPASNVGMGIVVRCEALSLDLIHLCC